MPTSSFTRSYNSFSGVDITAVVGSRQFATLQGISYQVSREKAPVYTMGSPDPRGFARGKRAIAGSLVFIQFDQEPIISELGSLLFLADKDELRPEWATSAETSFESVSMTPDGAVVATAPNVLTVTNTAPESLGEGFTGATPWYADQILPFDIVLTAANEYGYMCVMKILGVELLNQGYGVSIDDINSEHSYTYVCTGILPWKPASKRHAALDGQP